MTKDKITTISGTIISDDVTLTFSEICSATRTDPELINQLIEYHVIRPVRETGDDLVFDHICLKRVRLARNFYHDLEINLPGIALAIEMLEEIEALEAEIDRLK